MTETELDGFRLWQQSLQSCQDGNNSFCLKITVPNQGFATRPALQQSITDTKKILESVIATGPAKSISVRVENMDENVYGYAEGNTIALNSTIDVCELATATPSCPQSNLKKLIDSSFQFDVNRTRTNAPITSILTQATGTTILLLHEVLHTMQLVCFGDSAQYCVDNRYVSDSARAITTGGFAIETDGGAGTSGFHWDETTYAHEIMTGWLDFDPRFNQALFSSESSHCSQYVSTHLTAMTTTVLKDLGYGLADGVDSYVVPAQSLNAGCKALVDAAESRRRTKFFGKPGFRHRHSH
jgi:hypothetical protein